MFGRSKKADTSAAAPHALELETRLDPPEIPATSGPTSVKLLVRVRSATGEKVTGVRMRVSFAKGVRAGLAFRTSPNRKLLGPLVSGDVPQAELQVGIVEPEQTHAFLMQLTAPDHDAGELEVAHAELHYDSATSSRRMERRLAVRFVAEAAEAAIEEEEESQSELAGRALEAYRDGDKAQATQTLKRLMRACKAGRDNALVKQLRAMSRELEASGRLTREMLDVCLAVSTADADESSAALYDVVLVEAGEHPIRVAREIREVTGLGLREVSELIREEDVEVGHALRFAQAGALKRRIESAGGRAELRRRPA